LGAWRCEPPARLSACGKNNKIHPPNDQKLHFLSSFPVEQFRPNPSQKPSQPPSHALTFHENPENGDRLLLFGLRPFVFSFLFSFPLSHGRFPLLLGIVPRCIGKPVVHALKKPGFPISLQPEK
jgi:hypothetical protein